MNEMIKMKPKNKRAQEEIVGFAMIVIIVSIILMFFLVFSLSSGSENEKSYEASSFLQAALSYTSDCMSNFEYLPVDELIASCYNEKTCELRGEREDVCDVLNDTLNGLLAESWPVGEDRPEKGYKMEAVSGEETMFSISEGNITRNLKMANQIIPESGAQIRVSFTAYS